MAAPGSRESASGDVVARREVHPARQVRSREVGTDISWKPATPRALVMAFLGGLFLLRVVGQVLATYAGVSWLPAVEHWQSGLLPYPALLASQIVILGTMGAVIADVWRGKGRFVEPRPRLASAVRWFGSFYLASMIVRYVLSMALRPEWRWFGPSIPIVFHCVLATFLLVYAGVLAGHERSASPDASRQSGGNCKAGRRLGHG